MKSHNFLFVIFFILIASGCSHFFLNDKVSGKSLNVPELKEICIRHGVELENSFIFDKTYFHHDELTKLFQRNKIKINCEDENNFTFVYQVYQKSENTGYFIISLGISPAIIEERYEIKIFNKKQQVSMSRISGTRIISLFLIPFFPFVKNEPKILHEEIMKLVKGG